ncbi:hypothetical protein BaRGS_00028511 [Batillaria attramentaria]|uniref:P2X purinoreceptor 7 intracellular domain-containing protein n=1 Tax=Batillaria attramentaria TaxID=370345 RepID=A0ABD0K078_9CAEN
MCDNEDSASDLGSDLDNGSLLLSCASSDFDGSVEKEPVEVILPYQFEPEEDHSDADERASLPVSDGVDETDQRSRLALSANWCQCQLCGVMPTANECRCCMEIDEMRVLMDGVSEACITQHPGFATVCLDQWVLRTAYWQYRQQYSEQINDENRRYRYTAYRQLVRFVWHFLGRHIRVVLPACAVLAIRRAFSSADGSYTGFSDNYMENK